MARKTKTRTITRVVQAPARKEEIVVVNQAAPRRYTRRARATVKKARILGRHYYQRSKERVHVGMPEIVGSVVAGYALGWIDKGGLPIPTIPMLGRAGTVAVVCAILAKHHPLIAKAALASASIAGYELGKQGTISGEYVGYGVVPQVAGIATQV